MQALNRISLVGICPSNIYSKDIYTVHPDGGITTLLVARVKVTTLAYLSTKTRRNLLVLRKGILENRTTFFYKECPADFPDI